MLRTAALTGLLAGAAILGACTQDGRQADYATALPSNFGLYYLDEGASAKLAYGQANSDNVGLMLQCEKGSRVVEVTDALRSSQAPTLTLAAAGRSEALKAEVQAAEGPAVVTARTGSGSPVLSGFRQSGKLEVAYAGLRYGVVAKPDEKAGVERFFRACEQRS